MPVQNFLLDAFRGGLVTNYSNDSLNQDEFERLDNVDIDTRNALTKRFGYKDTTLSDADIIEKYGDFVSNPTSFYDASVFNGRQQGLFKANLKPFRTTSGNSKYDFENMTPAEDDDDSFDVQLCAVDGKLYVYKTDLVVNNFNYLTEFKDVEIFTTNESVVSSKIFFDNLVVDIKQQDEYATATYELEQTVFNQVARFNFKLEEELITAETFDLIKFRIDYFVGYYDLRIDSQGNIYNAITPAETFVLPNGLHIGNDLKFVINTSTVSIDVYENEVLLGTINGSPTGGQVGEGSYRIQTDFFLKTNTSNINNIKYTVSEFRLTTASSFVDFTNPEIESTLVYPINGVHSIDQFQTSQIIEGIQFGNELIIATGTKTISVRYVRDFDSGLFHVLVAQELDEYATIPTTQDFTYKGANHRLQNPLDDVSDSTGGATFAISAIRTSPLKGVLGQDAQIKAYLLLEAGKTIADYEFKWERQRPSEDTYTEIQAYTSGDTARIIDFVPDEVGNWKFKVYVQEVGNVDPALIKVSALSYTISETNENDSDVPNRDELNRCTRVLMYQNRLVCYGNNTSKIYVSIIKQPQYVPTSGIIDFKNTRNENLTAVIPFKDILIAFTENTIQGLKGRFSDIVTASSGIVQRIVFDTSIGAIAPYSCVVAQDVLIFLSRYGIQALDSIDVVDERINLTKLDDSIDNIVPRDKDASAVIYDNKYYIFFPNTRDSITGEYKALKYNYQYVYDRDDSRKPMYVWTQDNSINIGAKNAYLLNGQMQIITNKDKILTKLDPNVSTNFGGTLEQGELWEDDGYVYKYLVRTKKFSFNLSGIKKKLKNIFIGFINLKKVKINAYLNVYGDNGLVLDTDNSRAELNEQGIVEYIKEEIPNVQSNTSFFLGSAKLGESTLGFNDELYRFFKLLKCNKSYDFQVEVRNEENTYFSLTSIGMQWYTTGKIPRQTDGSL